MIGSSNRAPKPSGRLFRWASLFLLAGSAVAGECSPPTILVNAFDGNFGIQSNLHAKDLSVEVNGKQVQVLSVSLDSYPRRIVLMVDSSGSMGPSRESRGWGIALPAAAYAVDTVPTSGTAALVTFSDKLQRESNDFENRNVVGPRVLDLKKRQPQGGTLLFDSIHEVLNSFTELHFGDAIYVVTDGGDNKSKTSLAQLRQELISRGIRIFAFLLRRENFQTEEEIRGVSQMEDLAEFTGGSVVQISSREIVAANHAQLDKLAARIIVQVENFYRVEVALPAEERAARVKVSFVDRNRRKNSRSIVYSHQVVPCPPPSANVN